MNVTEDLVTPYSNQIELLETVQAIFTSHPNNEIYDRHQLNARGIATHDEILTEKYFTGDQGVIINFLNNNINELIAGDKEWLIISARILGYGNEYPLPDVQDGSLQLNSYAIYRQQKSLGEVSHISVERFEVASPNRQKRAEP